MPRSSHRQEQQPIPATVVLALPPGSYRAERIDTKTAELAGIVDLVHSGGDRTLESTQFSTDVALRISEH